MLRKAVSDVSSEVDKCEDLEAIGVVDREEVIKQAECECCGLKDDCTVDYMEKVKSLHSGKWVCGLCSEAVKERLRRAPQTAMNEALNLHRDFCQRFNTTTRLNPKLSFTFSMRDYLAKRSRNSKKSSAPILARSSSCVPRIDVKQITN